MVFSCGDALVLIVGNRGITGKVEVGAGECGSVVWKLSACSVQNWGNVLRFRDVGSVARDDRVAVAEVAVSVKEGEAEEVRVEDWLRKSGYGVLGEFHSGIARLV